MLKWIPSGISIDLQRINFKSLENLSMISSFSIAQAQYTSLSFYLLKLIS